MDKVRASYDAVAAVYAREIGGELAAKPLDRALLAAVVELVAGGVAGGAGGGSVLADVGCGPGHVTAYLAGLGADAVGVDLSAGMVATARERYPDLSFQQGDLCDLPARAAAWGGVVCLYTIIHLDLDGRRRAYAELARAIRPGGWLLLAFHTEELDHGVAAGGSVHLGRWWGHDVDLDFHFLDPAEVVGDLAAAGFTVEARLDRGPVENAEAPTRRCYVLARRAPIP